MGATSRLITLSIFLLVFVSVNEKISLVSAQCRGDLPGLMAQCPNYVRKSGPKLIPSKECCEVVNTADVPCVCKFITKDVEELISMEKVVFVAKYCGKVIPSGTKCGSYVVPKSSTKTPKSMKITKHHAYVVPKTSTNAPRSMKIKEDHA